MGFDVGQQTLVSRITDAIDEGFTVHILISGRDTAERCQNPISSGGVLSFKDDRGVTIRILESAIIGMIESHG